MAFLFELGCFLFVCFFLARKKQGDCAELNYTISTGRRTHMMSNSIVRFTRTVPYSCTSISVWHPSCVGCKSGGNIFLSGMCLEVLKRHRRFDDVLRVSEQERFPLYSCVLYFSDKGYLLSLCKFQRGSFGLTSEMFSGSARAPSMFPSPPSTYVCRHLPLQTRVSLVGVCHLTRSETDTDT